MIGLVHSGKHGGDEYWTVDRWRRMRLRAFTVDHDVKGCVLARLTLALPKPTITYWNTTVGMIFVFVLLKGQAMLN